MKPILLFVALSAIGSAAFAADNSAPRATPSPTPVATPATAPRAERAPTPRPERDDEQDRHELEALRGQLRELSRKMADLTARMGDVGPRAYAFRYLSDPDRAIIGVVMESDKRGVRIGAVTPGGPAEKAGLKAGDIITAVNGKSVVSGKEDPDAAIDKFRSELDDLKVGDAVKLTTVRDGKNNDTTIKAERREVRDWPRVMAFTEDMEQLAPQIDRRVDVIVNQAMGKADRAMQQVQRSMGSLRGAELAHRSLLPWWGLNLANLDKDLGSYFGTDKGVLVVSADKDMGQIKAGDVLLEVNGKAVDRPEQAMRAIREQEPGSEMKLKVLRQHKEQILSMTAPKIRPLFIPEPPQSPEPPEAPTPPRTPHATAPPPPAAPTPPTPPTPPTLPREKGFEA
jgi:PDZ domain